MGDPRNRLSAYVQYYYLSTQALSEYKLPKLVDVDVFRYNERKYNTINIILSISKCSFQLEITYDVQQLQATIFPCTYTERLGFWELTTQKFIHTNILKSGKKL